MAGYLTGLIQVYFWLPGIHGLHCADKITQAQDKHISTTKLQKS